MTFSPERCAGALLGARRVPAAVRRPLSPLSGDTRPETLADGITAQRILARLAGADAPAGFKIGATASRMQDYLGLDGPAAAFMARENLHGSGSTLSREAFLNPGVECEIAVHLHRDLPPGPCTPEQAAAAVDLLMAGIELVENRYPDLKQFGTPALVADGVFHAAAVLGTPTADWPSMDLEAIPGEMEVNGEVVARGKGGELLGHPMAALAWLAASSEAAAFGGLRAGHIVMLGSVTPPVWLDVSAPDPIHVAVRFAGLEPASLTLV